MIPLLLLLALGGLMHAARSFSDTGVPGAELAFGFLLLTAYFTAKIVSRLGLPKLTGYIIAGVIVGPFVLELVTTEMTGSLKIVSGTASAIIALEAGAELELARIRPVLKTLRALTVLSVLGTAAAIAGVIYAMRGTFGFLDGLDGDQTLVVCALLGIVLAAKSPAVVMALIAETRAEGPLTSTILASVVVADLCVIICYSIMSAITSAVIGGGLDVIATTLGVSWALLGSVAFGIVTGMLIGQFLRSIASGASLFAVMICVVVAEVGTRIQLDPLIVMLAAGIWLRNFARADPSTLFRDFAAAQLPVFLVFFALAGAGLHIQELWTAIVPVAIIALVRAASLFVGAKIATAVTGAPPVVTKYVWYGMVPQAGLALALALVLTKSFPSFGPEAAVILFGVVGLNECIAPILLRLMLVRSGEAGKKQGVDFAASGH
ncbi:MAG: cation:proton antiporter [Kofleriaceae bacterium]